MSSPDQPLLDEVELAFDELPDALRTERPLGLLARAVERRRLPHALLLAGPRGTGKRHAAVRLAQLLACQAPSEAGPCLCCASCRRTARGIDPDVVVLDPPFDPRSGRRKSEIPVASVRALQERLALRSSGRRRFVLVRPADRLSDVAQEALLKTLEEPPAGVTLALLTERPDALKPTIRSRCQLLRCAPLPAAALTGLLVARGLAPEAARLAAALSGGSLVDALEVDAQEAGEAWLDRARALYEILGPKGEARARDVALELVGDRKVGRDEVAARLRSLQRILRDVLLAGELADASDDDLAGRLTHPGGVRAVRALTARLDPAAAARAIEAIEQVQEDLELHVSSKVAVTALLLSLHELRARPAPAGRR